MDKGRTLRRGSGFATRIGYEADAIEQELRSEETTIPRMCSMLSVRRPQSSP
jgi:hypothetical protein